MVRNIIRRSKQIKEKIYGAIKYSCIFCKKPIWIKITWPDKKEDKIYIQDIIQNHMKEKHEQKINDLQ